MVFLGRAVKPVPTPDLGAVMSQTQTLIGAKRVRKYFGKITEQAEMPNLIEVQKESHAQFLQMQKRSLSLLWCSLLGQFLP